MISISFASPPDAEEKEWLLKKMREYKSQTTTCNKKASGQQNGELLSTQ